MKLQDRTLRIIGGNWRGRKVTFADNPDIRPTADRIRETLFNWLMHDISHARCLDLYAGSGILSIEALSRGAQHVTLVDTSLIAIRSVEASLATLGADPQRYTLAQASVQSWLQQTAIQVDIVFMDPPFADDRHYADCALIENSPLAPKIVYIESGSPLKQAHLPATWSLYRQKSAGSVHYGICHCS